MTGQSEKLLDIINLRTSFRIEGEYYAAVDGVDLSISQNEVFAIVGESGCGKSAIALSIARLHNMNYTQIDGQIIFQGQDVLKLGPGELNKVRGKGISMIFQDPLTALNPLHRVGAQIEESLIYHTSFNKSERKDRAIGLLDQVGMVNPALTYSQFPHELSGGMRQRAMIALAIAAQPALLIADEPTTALDVTIQAQILGLLKNLQAKIKSSIILITHDLGVVAETADRVAVMYAGQIVEEAPVEELFENPKHPYTRSLLNSIPGMGGEAESRLHTIQGIVPGLKDMPRQGCRFADRIPWIDKSVHEENPTYHLVGPEHYVLCTCYENFTLKEQ
ncbi:MAG: ABC transporter ATP-binding protein [Defluviitaleaceae bacterium]|nr:ABC transporter ATP-binding protein [Defluviitaleaceae bacterium]